MGSYIHFQIMPATTSGTTHGSNAIKRNSSFAGRAVFNTMATASPSIMWLATLRVTKTAVFQNVLVKNGSFSRSA